MNKHILTVNSPLLDGIIVGFRSVWDQEREAWYFSIVDVVAVLTDSPNPRKYWSVLKTRLKKGQRVDYKL